MTDNTNTKKEIIHEILAIADYLRENKLFNMTRSASSLDLDRKENLLELRTKMLAVIIGDRVKKGLKGEDPDLQELGREYQEKVETIRMRITEERTAIHDEVKSVLTEWLGDDLEIWVSDNNIRLGILGTGEHPHNLNIDIYYREPNEWGEKKPSVIEINQPTFGSWNPKAVDNADIRQFFGILNELANGDKEDWYHLNKIKDLMDKGWAVTLDRIHSYDELEKEYHDKMVDAISPIVTTMKF